MFPCLGGHRQKSNPDGYINYKSEKPAPMLRGLKAPKINS